MTIRTDLVIDWTVSPRLIMVEAPSVTITVQDLVDTLRDLESELEAMNDKRILGATGKDALGGSRFVGITATLQDAQLTFEARGGPSFATCTVTDGNLVAVDDVSSIIDAIAPSDYTWVRQELDVSPGLIESGVSGLTPSEAIELTTAATESTGAHTEATSAHTEAAAAAIDADTAATESTSANAQATAAAASSATAATEAAASAIDAALARKLDSNKAIVSLDDLTVTVYDDNGVDVLYVFDISVDKRQRIPQ